MHKPHMPLISTHPRQPYPATLKQCHVSPQRFEWKETLHSPKNHDVMVHRFLNVIPHYALKSLNGQTDKPFHALLNAKLHRLPDMIQKRAPEESDQQNHAEVSLDVEKQANYTYIEHYICEPATNLG